MKISKVSWTSLLNYVGIGQTAAAQFDAAMVLVVVAQVEDSPGGKVRMMQSVAMQGFENSDETRSEAAIAAIESLARGMRETHVSRFSKQPKGRIIGRPGK